MFPDDPPSPIKEDDDLEEIGVEKKMEPSAPGGGWSIPAPLPVWFA